jgi:metal-responsive CopG/Arc/MetJ family transcriptional regulator
MATRSISVSLEERLLRELDQELGRSGPTLNRNRSAALTEAVELWLKQRRLHHLNQSYAELAQLEGGDLEAAKQCATAIGTTSLATLHG